MTTPIFTPRSTTPNRPAKMASNQSLNHLLNFTLPPRQQQAVPRRSRKYGTQHGVWNKERFVNAQYRFVMNPTGDYTVHFADPDIFFQWQDILQVIVPRSSARASAAGQSSGQDEGHTTCPICLSPPAAPRMTKCGHVFCFPCILHLINTSDDLKWIRCPICFDSVNEKQLKAVKFYDGPSQPEEDTDNGHAEASSTSSTLDNDSSATLVPGSTLRMRLMQRPQITTLALPRSKTWPSDIIPPHQAPFHFLPDVYAFSKFMLATPAYLIEDLTRDLDQLAAERRALAGDELGLVFVEAAEQKLRMQMAKAAALETPALQDAVDRALRDLQELQDRLFRAAARVASSQPSSAPAESSPETPAEFLATQPVYNGPSTPHPVASPKPAAGANANRNSRQRRNLNPPPPSMSTYYYYQSASGMPIFLHPLDIRILVSHYSGYASFPDTITVRVEAFNEGTVNDDLRKRCKYLAHMPEGADVVFVEADLESVVGHEGLRSFDGLLKARRARRKEKGKKDEKARAKAEEREKEREQELRVATAHPSWTETHDIVVPPLERPLLHVEEFPAPDVISGASPDETRPHAGPTSSGAWGGRSFASALHAPARPSGVRPARRIDEDDWEVDVAWQELEQRIATSGGRKKRGNKMVILGGAGGRRR
ncbi:hypothetical protein PUNSTDRAFT_57998 [Punctularia strigosozonata HHB-11173 SS5]|uniref:uncharacterized protein n=1 Tax=Punctularia strigosozonata (strain HHB-11173) TaxID=741275 RepID=UPI0004417C6D|nr:uncharacterized protein PUNSTDRAFT_57998 [Punctularia strigosozonata HHB-11173 SS5]EIN13850.1 hypothetical protein PUNSTDRAFT_57998 [Punctularia strigosozonata HHB-11173 SS5]